MAPLWRELAWGVTYNNKNLATFSCLRLFFARTAFQFEQNTQVTVDICSKGGAAEVYIHSKLRIYPFIWLQLVENLVCAYQTTALSVSRLLKKEWRYLPRSNTQ